MLDQRTAFSNPGANITHNAIWPLGEITGGYLSDYIQLPLEPPKASYYNVFTSAAVLQLPSKCLIKKWLNVAKTKLVRAQIQCCDEIVCFSDGMCVLSQPGPGPPRLQYALHCG